MIELVNIFEQLFVEQLLFFRHSFVPRNDVILFFHIQHTLLPAIQMFPGHRM